jgi:predicted ATPase
LAQAVAVIASVTFRNFKALRHTRVDLRQFNLVIGPNGSGKTSLIEALQRLRSLAPLGPVGPGAAAKSGSPEIEFRFTPVGESVVAFLSCVSELQCDTLRIEPPGAPAWPQLQRAAGRIRRYALDHEKMGQVVSRREDRELTGTGSNLAAVLAGLERRAPDAFSALSGELLRILPEFRALEVVQRADDRVEFGLRLQEDGYVPAADLSQGVLYLTGVLTLAFCPDPPSVLCIEEVDRGIHPRMLREIRDALYRLSYPESFQSSRPPVQIVATTHSPYFIDLFRDHPEEVIISQKHGRAAHFERLTDRADLPELLREGSLGDMWFSGILGGVPEE